MKTIELKAQKETLFNGEPIILDTYRLIRESINNQPANGYSIEEMMIRLKLASIFEAFKKDFTLPEGTKIEDVNGEYFGKTIPVELEDADYNVLKELVTKMRWAIPSQFIIDFVKSL